MLLSLALFFPVHACTGKGFSFVFLFRSQFPFNGVTTDEVSPQELSEKSESREMYFFFFFDGIHNSYFPISLWVDFFSLSPRSRSCQAKGINYRS